jgi:hypothetical protein
MQRRVEAPDAIARTVACLILTCLLALVAAAALALMLTTLAPVWGAGVVCAGAALRLAQEHHRKHRR